MAKILVIDNQVRSNSPQDAHNSPNPPYLKRGSLKAKAIAYLLTTSMEDYSQVLEDTQ